MRRSSLLTRTFAFSGVLCLLVVMAACHKTNKNDSDNGYASEHATAEKTFDDVQCIADNAASLSSGSHMSYRNTGVTTMGCATVTRSGNTFTIDFGPADCTGLDGRVRRGRILVAYTGQYTDSGSAHTITFDSYYQNDNKVTGTKTVTNIGHNSLGQPMFSVSVNGSVTLPGGGTFSATWSRLRTWTAGYNTPADWSDDAYAVSGSGTLTRANGSQVAVNIPTSTPLIFVAGCRWIEAGTIAFTVPGGGVRTLNYGNTPACDNTAQLTLPNGTVHTITMQ